MIALVLATAPGCDHDSAPSPSPSASASASPDGLTPELRAKVLARVGDKVITLGDYAAALGRMDEFERLRYQSAERRKMLLDQMIDTELLAQEAKRRGLDQRPDTQERLRQILRDALLEKAREDLPPPAEIAEQEVRAYYEAHKTEFDDPERRRVAEIVVGSRALAENVLAKARTAKPPEWGKLVEQYSVDKSPSNAGMPAELAGDLGIVTAPGTANDGTRVADPVRAAVFKIGELGAVYPEVVDADGKFHIVRLAGKTDARRRTYQEAERSIRVALVQEKIRQREEKLEEELRKRFPVKVNSAALDKVSLPPEEPSSAPPQLPH